MSSMLISGHKVLIDGEDRQLLSRYPWYVTQDKNTYYVKCEVWINGKITKLSMHRFVMGMGKHQVDHVNRNGLDNRKINLRYCNPSQQSYNRKRANKTGFKGVHQYGKTSYWAKATKNKKEFREGPFNTPKEAALAYDSMAFKLFGNFASLNFPGELYVR